MRATFSETSVGERRRRRSLVIVSKGQQRKRIGQGEWRGGGFTKQRQTGYLWTSWEGCREGVLQAQGTVSGS